MAYDITSGMNYSQIAAKFAAGGIINIEPTTYTLNPGSQVIPPIASGATINGNGAIFECWSGTNPVTAPCGSNNSYQRCFFTIRGSDTKVSNLTLKGRMGFYIAGNNHYLKNVIVNQHSNHPGAVYEHLNGPYAAFWIDGRSNGITYDGCEAWYTNHHGFGVFIQKYHYGKKPGETVCGGIVALAADPNGAKTLNTKYINCKAMHCGSRWEINGGNPWAWGYDMGESLGEHTFTATGCIAYDCLQGGFYAGEGSYDAGDCKHKQSCKGTFTNCHAERAGMRILEAYRAGKPVISDACGSYYMTVDFYGHGFRLTEASTLNNCTTKDCAHAGVIQLGNQIAINGHTDDGSYIGVYIIGGSPDVNNYTSINSRAISFAANSSSTKLTNFKIINFIGNAPILVNAPPSSTVRKLTDLQYWYTNDGAMKLTDGKAATTRSGFNSAGASSSINAQVKVNQSEYNSKSAVCKGHRNSGTNSNTVSVTTFTPSEAELKGVPSAGSGYHPPPIDTPVCNPGEINCAKKQKCQVDSIGNVAWVDISEDDPDYADYVSRCNPGAECIGTEKQCIGGKEYVCSANKLIYTGNTCTDTLVPYAGRPELKQGVVTKIYARDYAKGVNREAYMDLSPGINLGKSTYRIDNPGVDLVTWDERMVDNESDKTVVAYTETGEWLKYPVKVTTNGTYTMKFRASTGVSGSKIVVSIDGGDKRTIDIPFTSTDYATFQTFEGNVVAPYISENSVIKVEFIGDMNLLWFTCDWLNNAGARDALPTQLPVASFTASTTSGVTPLAVNFTDTSTGTPTQWIWDFGDGASSTIQNATHTYTTPGTYLVKLSASNQSGTSQSPPLTVVVNSTGLAPVPSFTMDVTEGKAPLTVNFTDTSTNNPTSWLWTFGDGPTSTSSEQNPSHTYIITPGNFSVRLTAQNAYGSDTKLFNYIVTYALKPTVDFIANKTSGICPFTVQFNATSSAPIATYAWDFGDGNTSTEKDPMHTYTNIGKYTVTLTVTADGQTGNKIRNDYIVVAEPVSTPPPPIENPIEITQLPYNTFVLRDEYGYICYIGADWYDHGGEGKAYHNVLNGTEYTYRRGTDAIELLDDSIITSTGEWVEYTISVADSSYYYMRLETKNSDPQARIKADVVDLSDRVMYTLFDMAVPVTGNEYTKYDAKSDIAKKFMFVQSEYTTIRFTFTGNFNFKSVSIMSSDTIEGRVNSTSYISPVPNIATLPFIINPYQFDKGGQGISYMDTTGERFIRKPVRDTDVDLITVGFGDSEIETLVTGTVKGEWVQYTINNSTINEYTDLVMDIKCSTIDPLSKMQIVFINENDNKTYDTYRQYMNSYMISPPLTNTFTNVNVLTLPIRVYNGKNIMRIYFDDNISLGSMTFRS